MKLGQNFVKYFIRFLGNGVSRKNAFEIYWPLAPKYIVSNPRYDLPCLNSTIITCWKIIWSITTSNVQTSLVIFLCLLGVYCLVFMYLILDMKFLNISSSKILNCESFQDQFSQSVRDRLNFYTSVTILECSMYFVDCCLWVSVTGPCAATRLQKIRQIVWSKII